MTSRVVVSPLSIYAATLVVLFIASVPRTARSQWQPDGALVCGAAKNQTSTVAVPDGAGGAIIAWTDARGGSNGDIYAQRVDTWGHPLWTSDGVPVCTDAADQSFPSILSDGAGGAIIAWTDARNFATTNFDLYAQRVNASGVTQWAANGLAISTATRGQYYPKMASNGAGGAILVWYDYRNNASNSDIYAARLTSAGTLPDGAAGIAISTGSTNEGSPSIMPYGGGGAIIAWIDSRNGSFDIYAARLSNSAVVLDPGGIGICQEGSDQYYPACVSDGAGGAIISWMDARNDAVYAQRINSAGAVQWASNGVAVASQNGSSIFDMPRMLADGSGGAIIAWPRFGSSSSDLNIFAQRINASGARQWLPDDVSVCNDPNDQRSSTMVSDGAGGVIVAWEDNRGGAGYDIYAQRMGPSGTAAWTPNGVVVCAADFDQHLPVAVPDGTGGAIVAWEDKRAFFESDIYAQRVRSNGQTVTGVGDTPSANFTLLPAWPNPFTGSTTLDVQLNQLSDVSIDVFDVAGRRVRGITLPHEQAGWRQITIDGQDNLGRPLPSGVYFCRVEAGGANRTQKIVLLK
jgi:FlgD Ig-like domain